MGKYLFLVAVVFVAGAAAYPTDLPRCRNADTECLKRVIMQTLQLIKSGRQDLNVMAIDPLRIDKLDIVQGDSSPIAITLNFRDLDVTGIPDIQLSKIVGFEADPSKSKYELEGTIPRLQLAGKYKIDGKVLVLPIQGKGRSQLTLDNVLVKVKFLPKVYQKNGQTHIGVDKFKLAFDTSRLHLYFENLFNGDKLLGDNMNNFLNENWQDILKELKPAIVDAFSQIFSGMINSIFSKISYEEAFES